MSPIERPIGGASAPQRIVRETQQLQQLVQALSDGQDVNFCAIHEVASRIMQAAYDGWKKAELAKIAPTRHVSPLERRRRRIRWRASGQTRRHARDDLEV
jgi:hypothetical protein